jgi:hypothetical protein
MNFVEVKPAIGGPRYSQMPGMDGIKRSAEQRNTPGMNLCRCAVRLRCRQSASRMTPALFSHERRTDKATEAKEVEKVKVAQDSDSIPALHFFWLLYGAFFACFVLELFLRNLVQGVRHTAHELLHALAGNR